MCMFVPVLSVDAQSCPTLCNPMDCSPPGYSAHEIFQARIWEWVAISFSRGSSLPRDQTQVSCIGRQIFYCLSHMGCPHLYYGKLKRIHSVLSRMGIKCGSIEWEACVSSFT